MYCKPQVTAIATTTVMYIASGRGLGVIQDGRKYFDVHAGFQGSGGKGVPQGVEVNIGKIRRFELNLEWILVENYKILWYNQFDK